MRQCATAARLLPNPCHPRLPCHPSPAHSIPPPHPSPPPCSNGVVPDNQFYGMLMRAAGAHGDLDAVLGLQAEMGREGLRPCAVRACSL